MTSTAQNRDPLLGSRIDGRYRIQGVLGRGGMGVVYEGVHEQLGRPVAIKVLSTGIAAEPTAIERFLREARTASSLTHGNIVDVTDLGELPDGRPYLVMPKMQGQDLLSLLTDKGPQSPARVVELLRGAAAALDLIHAKGYVHRDVKPENLMHVVREDGSEAVLLLDFGIVALTSSGDQRLTAQGIIFGTPVYLAPETMDSAEPDARTDVYSLAVVAYEMMTGRAPFEASPPIRLMQLKCTTDAPSMQAACGVVFPAALEAVVAKGLARDPKKRYAGAGEFVRALEAAISDPISAASPVRVPDGRSKDAQALPAALHNAGTPSPARGATDLQPGLGERLAKRKGLIIAAGLLPVLVAAFAWSGLLGGGAGAPAEGAGQADPTRHGASTLEPEPTIIMREASVEALETEQPAPLPPEPSEAPEPSEPQTPNAPEASPRKEPRKTTKAVSAQPAPNTVAATQPTTNTPTDSAALVKAASQALLAGQLDAADKLYADATRKDPRNAAAWRGLGLTSERMGRRDTAVQAFKRALELTPSGPQADSIRARLQKLGAS